MLNDNISLSLLFYLLLGCFSAVLVFRFLKRLSSSNVSVLEERLRSRQREIEQLNCNINTLNERLEIERQEKETLLSQCSALRTALKNEQEFSRERQAIAKESREQVREAFQSLSGQALERSSKLFLSLAENHLSKHAEASEARLQQREASFTAVVEPIQKTLQKIDSQIQSVEKDRLKNSDAMSASISHLLATHKELSKETATLSSALKSPVVTGKWGEMHLRRVVELAGLVEHCDFVEQPTLDSEMGKQRPDLLIHLPSGKSVVVDAKAPVKDYLASCRAEGSKQQKLSLEKHARALRKHVQQLSQKQYYEVVAGSAGFVVLFLPAEPLYSAALREDPELTEYAASNNVVLATPLSLIALCRTIATGWREVAVHENADEIAALGRELLKRLTTFSDHFEDLYRGLERSTRAYNKIVGSYESRVLVSARELAANGVDSTQQLKAPAALNSALRIPVSRD